jgi:hypothetical protein
MGYRTIAAGLVLGAGVVLCAAQETGKPLVRKDLLVFGSPQSAPPLRDIFRPKAAAGPAVPRPLGPGPTTPAAGPASKPGAPGGFTLNLSYIGSVDLGGRTIALVLRGGQTVSVGEGDEISPGYKVVQVTAREIVVEGPNGERRTFRLQGDRP